MKHLIVLIALLTVGCTAPAQENQENHPTFKERIAEIRKQREENQQLQRMIYNTCWMRGGVPIIANEANFRVADCKFPYLTDTTKSESGQ